MYEREMKNGVREREKEQKPKKKKKITGREEARKPRLKFYAAFVQSVFIRRRASKRRRYDGSERKSRISSRLYAFVAARRESTLLINLAVARTYASGFTTNSTFAKITSET